MGWLLGDVRTWRSMAWHGMNAVRGEADLDNVNLLLIFFRLISYLCVSSGRDLK
jgi:hypothetical protein